MIKVLVFDFDGVIVDSNHLKIQGYFDIFPKDKETQSVVKNVLAEHWGKPRFFIIAQIFEKRKGLPEDAEFYVQRYNKIVDSGVAKCPMVKGATEALEKLFRRYALYLSSGTPLDNLKKIVRERSLNSFFRGVYGAPTSKVKHLTEIIEKEKVSGREVLAIGDRQSDLEAAEKFDCGFIGVKNSFNDFTKENFHILDDLRSLPNIINVFHGEEKNKNSR